MSSNTLPNVELFVRADSSNRLEGEPCVLSQQWKMTLHVLQQKGLLEFSITPVHLDNPPQSYNELYAARVLPVAWIESGEIAGESVARVKIMSTGALEMLLHQLQCDNLNPSLTVEEVRTVETIFEDLYKQFMNYIRNDVQKGLITRLTKLDDHLSSTTGPFLLGEKISYADCQLMPKLQHIRVVGLAYKKFDITHTLVHLWGYIANMYETEAFTSTCPSDRDILIYHGKRDPLPKHVRPVLMGSACLTEIPDSARRPSTGSIDSS